MIGSTVYYLQIFILEIQMSTYRFGVHGDRRRFKQVVQTQQYVFVT